MKEMSVILKKMKNEKGSITLFVLTSMLFFLIISLLSFNMLKNKIMSQEKQIKIIQDEYKILNIDQIYDETVNRIY